MNIVLADRDEEYLLGMKALLSKLYPEDHIVFFTDPMYVVKYGLKHEVDVLFTEIDMNHLNGFTLIQMVRGRYHDAKVVIVEESEKYTDEASLIKVDGYLIKPIESEEIKVLKIDKKKRRRTSREKDGGLGQPCPPSKNFPEPQ